MALINERIKQMRLKRNLTLLDVAEHLGVQEATAQRYESGEIKNIKHETVLELAKLFNCSPSYLMGWEENNLFPSNISQIEKKKLPMLGRVAAGEPKFAEQQFEYYVEVGAEIKADFCLKVKGDSMVNARINDGDLVFIRQQPTVEDGEIACVLIDDEATLKRVYMNEDNITLTAENPKYKPLVYRAGDGQIRILGKAVAFQSDVR